MRRKRQIEWQRFSYFFAMVPLDGPASLRRTIRWTGVLGQLSPLPGARRIMRSRLRPIKSVEAAYANQQSESSGLRRFIRY